MHALYARLHADITRAPAAFNSNNASSVAHSPVGDGGVTQQGDALPAPRSAITRTYLRRAARFPPHLPGTPRNPKWALNVRRAAAALALRGPHAVAPQIHNVWDRSACGRCAALPELLRFGLTPEIDPCAGLYAALKSNESDAAAAREALCARNVCAGGAGGVVGEAALKMHHYVLPRGAKSYRRAGRGDGGAKRDRWDDDVADEDALRFAVQR